MTQLAGRKEELVTERGDGFWKISIEREEGREGEREGERKDYSFYPFSPVLRHDNFGNHGLMRALAAWMGVRMQAKHQGVTSHRCASIIRLLHPST